MSEKVFPLKKMCQITIIKFQFSTCEKVYDSDFAYFFEETSKVKIFLRLSQLLILSLR